MVGTDNPVRLSGSLYPHAEGGVVPSNWPCHLDVLHCPNQSRETSGGPALRPVRPRTTILTQGASHGKVPSQGSGGRGNTRVRGGTISCTTDRLVYVRREMGHGIEPVAGQSQDVIGWLALLWALGPPQLGEARGRKTRGGSPGGAEDQRFGYRGPKSKNPWSEIPG